VTGFRKLTRALNGLFSSAFGVRVVSSRRLASLISFGDHAARQRDEVSRQRDEAVRQIDSAQQCDEGNPQRDEALRQIALSLLRQIALSLKRIDISSTPILLDHFAGKREQLEFPLENPIFHASVVRY
jgi:hypothetical protein